ncbi:hypothetical protein BDV96DRAFT_645982 [Lophiotrema nucula]|uniref:Uncharacterized protein n=1 Tax=Lophiotrema nucula TaxID=690887 RepID=A0A6A5ZBN1_9PLEO|nr:hypothetical protein BDV96DRAFT_645982 [Lophiotrema nucula]
MAGRPDLIEAGLVQAASSEIRWTQSRLLPPFCLVSWKIGAEAASFMVQNATFTMWQLEVVEEFYRFLSTFVRGAHLKDVWRLVFRALSDSYSGRALDSKWFERWDSESGEGCTVDFSLDRFQYYLSRFPGLREVAIEAYDGEILEAWDRATQNFVRVVYPKVLDESILSEWDPRPILECKNLQNVTLLATDNWAKSYVRDGDVIEILIGFGDIISAKFRDRHMTVDVEVKMLFTTITQESLDEIDWRCEIAGWGDS